ncbi:MAG: hypothetical protein ACI9YT_000066 [Halobacteriales archaeon]|jgi:hypothetical protein
MESDEVTDTGPKKSPEWGDSPFRIDVSPVRRTSWASIALVVAFNAIVNLLVFPNESILDGVFRPTARATEGLVRPTLLVNLVGLVVVVWGVMVRGIGLEPRDVGLDRRRLRRGILFTLVLWLAIQVVGAIEQLSTTGTIGVAGSWTPAGAGPALGAFLAQALGNAPLAVFADTSFAAWLTDPAMVVLILAWTPIVGALRRVENAVGWRRDTGPRR